MFPKTQVCFLCFLPLSSLEEVGHVLPLSHAGVCGVWGWTGGMPRALHLTAVATEPHETRTHTEGSIHPGHAN